MYSLPGATVCGLIGVSQLLDGVGDGVLGIILGILHGTALGIAHGTMAGMAVGTAHGTLVGMADGMVAGTAHTTIMVGGATTIVHITTHIVVFQEHVVPILTLLVEVAQVATA